MLIFWPSAATLILMFAPMRIKNLGLLRIDQSLNWIDGRLHIRKLLGHKNLSTVYESYSGAETQAAIDLYDDVILDRKIGRSGKLEGGASEPHLDPLNPFLKGPRR